MKSYQESREHSWTPNDSKKQFSPAYVYNQIPHYSNGTSIEDAKDCIINNGACSIYYIPSSSNSTPNSNQKEKASNFKAIKRYKVCGVNALKNELAKGNCAVINVS